MILLCLASVPLRSLSRPLVSSPSSFCFRSVFFLPPCSPAAPRSSQSLCSLALRFAPLRFAYLPDPVSCSVLPVLNATKVMFTITPRLPKLKLLRVRLRLTPGSRDASRADNLESQTTLARHSPSHPRKKKICIRFPNACSHPTGHQEDAEIESAVVERQMSSCCRRQACCGRQGGLCCCQY